MRLEAPEEDNLGEYLNPSTENINIEMINTCTSKGKQPTAGYKRQKFTAPPVTGEYLTHSDTPIHEVEVIV